MATLADLITACKTGLNISQTTTTLDDLLTQKILAVQGYMQNAGVSATVLSSDLATGAIVLGVTDLWELTGGAAKFSTLFDTLVSQLSIKSYADANAFQVNYDGNGNTAGIVPIDTTAYVQGSIATVLGNLGALTKMGYTFSGWNTAADGSGTDYGEGSQLIIGYNVTLYARWVVI